jgi:RNA polymerase sigma-70 factor (ECF subfamily)
MNDHQWFAEQLALHRPRLRAVAYRLLGTMTEADDALQEAWLRTTRADRAAVSNPAAWLTTLVGRVCIDMLRARHARPEQLTGSWEPLISEHGNPEDASLHADAVGIALLVVLDSLEPAERLAVVQCRRPCRGDETGVVGISRKAPGPRPRGSPVSPRPAGQTSAR